MNKADGSTNNLASVYLPELGAPLDTQAPTAVLDAPSSVDSEFDFVLDGSRSHDVPPGQIVAYRWTLLTGRGGGLILGRTVETTALLLTIWGSRDPLSPGRYTFELQVVDSSGNVSAPVQRAVSIIDGRIPPPP